MDPDQDEAISTQDQPQQAAPAQAAGAQTDDNSGGGPSGPIQLQGGVGAVPVEDDSTGVDQQAQQQGAQQGNVSPSYGPLGGIADKIKKMLAGEGAVNPALLDQINEQASAGLKGTPADKAVYAIHDALQKNGPDAAAALVQANRVAYDTKNAFALAALKGTQGKPADLNASIKAANDAQEHMPDGSNIIYAPNGNEGVIAVAQMPGSKHTVQYNLTLDQYANMIDPGKGGQFDKVFQAGAPAQLQALANANASQDTGSDDEDKGDAEKAGEVAPGLKGGDVVQRTGLGYDKPQSLNSDEGAKGAEGQGRDVDYEAASERAQKLFPWASQGRQRQQYIASQLGEKDKQANAIAVAHEQGVNATDRAKIAAGGKVAAAHETAQGKLEGWKYSSDQKREAAQARLQQELTRENGLNQRSSRNNALRAILGKMQQNQPLSDEDNAMMKQIGAAADQTYTGQGAAPQAPAPQAKTPQGNNNVPPVNQRVVGQTTVTTGKGTFVWGSGGWQKVNGQ